MKVGLQNYPEPNNNDHILHKEFCCPSSISEPNVQIFLQYLIVVSHGPYPFTLFGIIEKKTHI